MARSNKIPYTAVTGLINDALQDPLLPRANPTQAFWQLPESDISRIQSSALPARTTYAIIGSGITGCSVAKNLLDLSPPDEKATVTVLEARQLTSGATGRNGGHLLSPVPEEFSLLEKHLGPEEATKIARFANRTLDKMYSLASESDPDIVKAAEVRRVTTVTGFQSEDVLKTAVESSQRYEECVPESKGDFQVFGAADALHLFNMKDVLGVTASPAGAFWPYRLVTGLFDRMKTRYPSQLSIETETPVADIQYDKVTDPQHPYILSTPRGIIRAGKIIHCTNGWSGHLLPFLRGKIFPLRGTMSVQEAGPSLPREGDKRSWSLVDDISYNAAEGTLALGLYYITQNAVTGDVYVGGERQHISELLSSDDTTMSAVSKHALENVLPSIYAQGWPDDTKPNVRKVWSGVMGFTPDHMPWIGRVPRRATGRDGDEEYIAAGFNGYGMPLCWGCGEAIAKLILGKDAEVREWLPDSFVISEKRLSSPNSTVEAGIAVMLWDQLGLVAKAHLAWKYMVNWLKQTLSLV